MAISRNFLIFRSVAFAVVTKMSGAAMVFIAPGDCAAALSLSPKFRWEQRITS